MVTTDPSAGRGQVVEAPAERTWFSRWTSTGRRLPVAGEPGRTVIGRSGQDERGLDGALPMRGVDRQEPGSIRVERRPRTGVVPVVAEAEAVTLEDPAVEDLAGHRRIGDHAAHHALDGGGRQEVGGRIRLEL